ncbi:MAG: hypothetical protein WC076_02300 [Terrimicrobiaceae bacterium]|nr:hypothetical protein [Terrimicrobiaceae bacterium]
MKDTGGIRDPTILFFEASDQPLRREIGRRKKTHELIKHTQLFRLTACRQPLNPKKQGAPEFGSGTTCLACDEMGTPSYGIEAHPFVYRVAQAKLSYATDPERLISKAENAFAFARKAKANTEHYPEIIGKCYGVETLDYLDRFRQAVEIEQDGSPEAGLLWMALVSSLRIVSEAGTAPWQYVLPGRRKTVPPLPEVALHKAVQMIAADIRFMACRAKPLAKLRVDDARKCATVPDAWATLVITSPPYANNYDYADATRLEMAFLGEIRGWGDLQETVRRHLVRACSQHAPPKSVNLDKVLAEPLLAPIRDEIVSVCRELSSVRLERGGKKTYNNMIACYFLDMAQTWTALRRVCASPSEVCFVIGDSAPYGVYVPVVESTAGFGVDRDRRHSRRRSGRGIERILALLGSERNDGDYSSLGLRAFWEACRSVERSEGHRMD